MRPVRRGPSPVTKDFDDYTKALPDLIARIGRYCSYCERPILTQLAVEHIQPKSLPHYEHLRGRWENFLLSCVNCNSTKKDKDVQLSAILLPDRDNTFAAFTYRADGSIVPAAGLADPVKQQAQDTLALTGLEKRPADALDENGKRVAIDRVSRRMEVWAITEDVRADLLADTDNAALQRAAIRTAQASGFFSIWMKVFEGEPAMRNRLIDAFGGTRASGCFDAATGASVSPAPNPDGLPDGGKI
ncbi:MAG: HNH endonuclease [Methylococcaceae bacterium]|nr:HNH endonuclease [Methylococcaceae bacterium]